MSNFNNSIDSNKRALDDSESSLSDRPHKQTIKQVSNLPGLIKYPFLLPLVLKYLSYDDVLVRVMLLSRSIKQSIPTYHVETKINFHRACLALLALRTFVLTFDKLSSVTTYNLAIFDGVRDLDFESCDEPIPPHTIPNSVTDLFLDENHEGPFRPGSLPPKLARLFCGHGYNYPLTPGLLPSTLKFLYTGDEFNWPLRPGSLPDGVTRLMFGQAFSQPLPLDVLPSSLTSLEFGLDYGVPLVLPPSLTELILWTPYQPGVSFPQGIPMTLKKLKLGALFHQTNPVLPPGVIPESVFHFQFRQPIVAGSIPSSVTRLSWGWEYPEDVSPIGLIPASVTHLSFEPEYSRVISAGLIPRTVRKLEVIGKLVADSIPDSVEHLILNYQRNDRPLEIGVIPGSVKKLQWFWCRLPIQVRRLPVKTEHGHEFVLISAIPNSVTHLQLALFNFPLLPGAIPDSVICLDLGCSYDQPFQLGSIPDSVKQLILPEEYKHSLVPGVIPVTTQVIFRSGSFFYEEDNDCW